MLLKLYKLGTHYPKTVFIFSLLINLFAFWITRNLRVENNLTALLPQNFESVQALKSMEEAFGGLGFLVVVMKGEDAALTEKFADELVPQVEQLPQVAFVDYKRPINYFKKRQWLFISLEDLQEMEARLDRSLELQKQGVSPIFNDLVDFADEEDRPDLTYEDIRQKYEKKYGFDLGSESAELTRSDEGTFVVFRVKIKTNQQNLDQGQVVVDEIQDLADHLKQKSEFASIDLSFSGDHVSGIETVAYLQKRMAIISSSVIALLILVLWLYLRRPTAVFLVGYPLLSGILWTGAIVQLTLGHLNVITGFAAGILAGLGSDYGIYLVSRFFQERSRGLGFGEAAELTFLRTGRATFACMLATAFAFLALLFSDFKVMVEFGIVGSLGLLMNYLAMVGVIPSLLGLREKWLQKRKKDLQQAWFLKSYSSGASVNFLKIVFSPQATRWTFLIVLLLGVASAFTLPHQTQIHFEDGRMDSLGLPSEKLYQKVAGLYGGTLQPTLLLVKGLEENQKVVQAFDKILHQEKGNQDLPFKQVLGLNSFLPEDQVAKRKILDRLFAKFEHSRFPVANKRQELRDSFQESLQSSSITLESLPKEVKRMFVSPLQEGVFATFLFPQWKDLNWQWMENYNDVILKVRQDYGLNFQAVDNPFVATEFVRMMEREAPKMLGTTALAILLVLLAVVRPLSRALLTCATLAWAMLLLSGAMYIFGVELNTLNLAAFPIILGTGIDCFVHLGLRFDETGDLFETLHEELPAILISNLTTTIGFLGLLFIPSAGLRSLGWTASLGFVAITLLCTMVFPRFLTWRR